MRLSVQIEFDKVLDLKTGKTSVVVGRGDACDLVVPHNSVSRTHCKIEFREGIFYITDLGSSNGTFIDGERLAPNKRSIIKSSSILVLGTIDCEIGDSEIIPNEGTKIINIQNSSNASGTNIRVSRIELNRPSITLAMEKQLKVKGPRNPVTYEAQNPQKPILTKKRIYIMLFILVAAIEGWLIQKALN